MSTAILHPIIVPLNHQMVIPSSTLHTSRYLFQPIEMANSELSKSHWFFTDSSSLDDMINMESNDDDNALLHLPIMDVPIDEECYDDHSLDCCDDDDMNDQQNDEIVRTVQPVHNYHRYDEDDDDDDSEIEEELQQIYQSDLDLLDDENWADHIFDVYDHDMNVNTSHALSCSPQADVFVSSPCTLPYEGRCDEVADGEMMDDEYPIYDDNFGMEPNDVFGLVEKASSSTTIASPTCVGFETQEMYDEINMRRHQLWKQSLKSSLFHTSSSSSSLMR